MFLIPRFAPWPLVRPNLVQNETTWVHMRFLEDALNEVTEVPALLYGAATVTDNKLATNPSSSSNYMALPSLTLKENEDFLLRISVNMPFSDSRFYNTIVGVYTQTSSPRAWVLGRIGNDTNKGRLHFTMVSGTTKYDFYGTSILAANTDYDLEVSRVNGVLRLFVNGKLETTTLFALGTNDISLPRMRTDTIFAEGASNTTHIGGGLKWDFQIKKGEGGHTEDYIPTALPAYVRPVYPQSLAPFIAAQYCMRYNSLEDEAGNGFGQLFGTASVAEGRITQANSLTSYFKLPVRKFGEEDFTIEFDVNLSTVNASWGSHVLGRWRAGGVTSEENCWSVWVGPQGQISWSMAKSSSAHDRETIITGNGTFKFNKDHNIVIQRIGTTVTVYLDQEQVVQGDVFDFPIRGAAPHYMHSLSDQNVYTMAGRVWNIRISDKAMYKENVVHSATFPAMPKEPVYIVQDGVVDQRFTINGATTENGKLTMPVGSFLSAPSSSDFAFDRGDFSIEIDFEIKSIPSVANAAIVPLIFWSSIGATGNPINYELFYYHDVSQITLATSYEDEVLNPTTSAALALNTEYNLRVIRYSGVVYFYLNDVMLFSVSMLQPMNQDTPLNFLVGRRIGGTGNVIWSASMLLRNMALHHEGRLDATKNSIDQMALDYMASFTEVLPTTANAIQSVELDYMASFTEVPPTTANAIQSLELDYMVKI